MGIYKAYLGAQELAGFDQYKYSCQDTSPLSNYVMHPFWNWVVNFCPKWLAPNLLTFIGFLCCIGHYLIPTILDYDFRASTLDSTHPIPKVAWFFIALFLFISHTLDGIDGKQARRTGTSSPLGELFDHGCDSWSTVLIASTFYSAFGRNEDGYSISVEIMYLVQWAVFFSFHSAHWEKYNTGVMYLPWGYDISMLGGTLLYLTTSIFGYGLWKIHLPLGLTPGAVLASALFAGTFIFALPTTLYNTFKSYRFKTGKMRTFGEAIRPLVSFFIAFGLCTCWVSFSRNSILVADVRAFFFMSGTMYANMSCKLIVAQMTNTRCELVNAFIYPLTVAVAVSLLIPGFPREAELAVVYLLTLGYVLAHLHYAVCVVIQMCGHLKIRCFHIKNVGEERLLADTQLPLPDDDDDEDDDDDVELLQGATPNSIKISV